MAREVDIREEALISEPLLKPGVYHPLVAQSRAKFINWYPVTTLVPSSSWAYDPAFEAAVKVYQRSSGLPATGIMDDATWAKLHAVSVDRVNAFEVENAPQPKGTNPLLWIAAAAAAWWALS